MTTNESPVYFTSSKNYWDFTNIHAFEKKQAMDIVWQKILIYYHEDEIFRKKYKMSFYNFLLKFNSLNYYSMMERNEDALKWKKISDVLDEYNNILNNLTS
jgi:hypothetical protein